MRYLNPQRSKNLQDRKGWIEGWEPRIKADEFIHGLGIGEAYLRHNGRPAKVTVIRADINPPGDFDLSEDLPRFSQGNEPPLNLTEKVNRVVMEKMRAAKNNRKGEPDGNNVREPKQSKYRSERKGSERPRKTSPELKAKQEPAEINPQFPGSERLKGDVSRESKANLDSLTGPSPRDSAESNNNRDAETVDQKQRDKLDWFSTWDED
jgi:hypothetical protein